MNPGQHLDVSWNRGGLAVEDAGARLSLRLSNVGYGDSLAAVAPTEPRSSGGRVVLRHDGLDEWYANGPLGVEQGFTLGRRPSANAAGRPLTLSLRVAGTLKPRAVAGGVRFEGAGPALMSPD